MVASVDAGGAVGAFESGPCPVREEDWCLRILCWLAGTLVGVVRGRPWLKSRGDLSGVLGAPVGLVLGADASD